MVSNVFAGLSLFCISLHGVGGEGSDCDIKLRIYHTCDSDWFEDYCIGDGAQLFHSKLYNSSNCNTVIMGMPFLSKANGVQVRTLVKAVTAQCNRNVILIEVSEDTGRFPSPVDYALSMAKLHDDAYRFAKVFNKAIQDRKLSGNCIVAMGFSLGAQTIGHMCRQLTEKCCHLYAIDAAGPVYFSSFPVLSTVVQHTIAVSATDASNVVFVQCNRGVFGTSNSLGHTNIIVNNGVTQPGGVSLPVTNLVYSHIFCNNLFADAIRRPGACQARQCNSYPGFISGNCNNHPLYQLTVGCGGRCGNNSDTAGPTYYMTVPGDKHCIGFDGSLGG